jgi:hypothetical protein
MTHTRTLLTTTRTASAIGVARQQRVLAAGGDDPTSS